MRAILKLWIITNLVACGGLNKNVASVEAPLTWHDADECSGAGCCIRGDVDGECIRPGLVTVMSSDGSHVETVRYVMKKDGGTFWGLADPEGNVIVKPQPGPVIALNGRALLRFDGPLVTPEGERRIAPSGIVSVDMPGSFPVHFAILKTYPDDKHCDVAPILPSGKLGAPVVRAMVKMGDIGSRRIGLGLGPVAVITSEPSDGGARASVVFDIAGRPIWVGRELRVHQVAQSLRAAGIPPFDPDLSYASLLLGPSPLSLSERDPNLYHPIGADGLPETLPKDVVGMVPFRVDPGYEHLATKQRGVDEVRGWVVVEKHGGKLLYRVGGGYDLAPLDVLKLSPGLSLLDEVRLVVSPDFPKGVVAGQAAAAWPKPTSCSESRTSRRGSRRTAATVRRSRRPVGPAAPARAHASSTRSGPPPPRRPRRDTRRSAPPGSPPFAPPRSLRSSPSTCRSTRAAACKRRRWT